MDKRKTLKGREITMRKTYGDIHMNFTTVIPDNILYDMAKNKDIEFLYIPEDSDSRRAYWTRDTIDKMSYEQFQKILNNYMVASWMKEINELPSKYIKEISEDDGWDIMKIYKPNTSNYKCPDGYEFVKSYYNYTKGRYVHGYCRKKARYW